MKPKIHTEERDNGMRTILINGVSVGPQIGELAADVTAAWLSMAWPDIVVAVLASSHVEQSKKKRKVRK